MKIARNSVVLGDCADILKETAPLSVDLIYLDPPFFTQKTQSLVTKDGSNTRSFDDRWFGQSDYVAYMRERLELCRSVLTEVGSLFLHCDKNASHVLRLVCEEIFGQRNFRSEIIWSYKRWSNSAKSLLPNHQTILYFSKSDNYTFNRQTVAYAPTTNIDQILQSRSRDSRNKAVYARDSEGGIISGGEKKGVPLGDVWEIPFLNPKAKERVNYPTQKPILLLERIIKLASNEGDLVLDPFCGSGTTLVAAKLLGRDYVGIDKNAEAVAISESRLNESVKTSSKLLEKGPQSYKSSDERLLTVLAQVEFTPIQRNSGLDALLKKKNSGRFIFVRLQKDGELVQDGINSMTRAMRSKGECEGVFVVFEANTDLLDVEVPQNIRLIRSPSAQINELYS